MSTGLLAFAGACAFVGVVSLLVALVYMDGSGDRD